MLSSTAWNHRCYWSLTPSRSNFSYWNQNLFYPKVNEFIRVNGSWKNYSGLNSGSKAQNKLGWHGNIKPWADWNRLTQPNWRLGFKSWLNSPTQLEAWAVELLSWLENQNSEATLDGDSMGTAICNIYNCIFKI